MGWGNLIIRRHINGNHLQILLEMFISKKTCRHKGCFPFSHQLQEKTLPEDFFPHSTRRSPGRSGLRGSRSISHFLGRLIHLRSASTAEARRSSLSPLRSLTRLNPFCFDQRSNTANTVEPPGKETWGSEKTKMEVLPLILTSRSLIITSAHVFLTSLTDEMEYRLVLFLKNGI